MALPVANLHRVPDHVPDDVAVFTEPLAAALDIPARVEIEPGHRVLVVGAGKLGQLIARVLVRQCGELLAVARRPERLARLEGTGCRTGLVGSVEAGTFDVAVECTGRPEGLDVALGALRARGEPTRRWPPSPA